MKISGAEQDQRLCVSPNEHIDITHRGARAIFDEVEARLDNALDIMSA